MEPSPDTPAGPAQAAAQARNIVNTSGHDILHSQPWEQKPVARAASAVLGVFVAAFGALAFRATLAAEGAPAFYLLAAIGFATAAVWVAGAPARYRRTILEPVALLLVAGRPSDEVGAVVAAIEGRDQVSAVCSAHLSRQRRP